MKPTGFFPCVASSLDLSNKPDLYLTGKSVDFTLAGFAFDEFTLGSFDVAKFS